MVVPYTIHFILRAFCAETCLPFCVRVQILENTLSVTQVGARPQPLPLAFQTTGENIAKSEGGLQVDKHQNDRPAGKN